MSHAEFPPHQPHSDTSRAAAASVREDSQRLRQEVYSHIRSCGAHGCTDEEGAAAIGLGGNTWRPRRVELEGKGWITRTTKRPTGSGRLAAVWVAT